MGTIRSKELDKLLLLEDYVVFDLETTAFSPKKGEIIDIGAIKVVKNKPVLKFKTLVNPKEGIPYHITKLTGINKYMVQNAKPYEEVLPKFLNFVGALPVVGHNVSFDIRFVKHYLSELGYGFNNKSVDTLKIGKELIKDAPNHKLETLCSICNIPNYNEHRAFADTCRTYRLYSMFQRHYINEEPLIINKLEPTDITVDDISNNDALIRVEVPTQDLPYPYLSLNNWKMYSNTRLYVNSANFNGYYDLKAGEFNVTRGEVDTDTLTKVILSAMKCDSIYTVYNIGKKINIVKNYK